jgi:hypothetical protein
MNKLFTQVCWFVSIIVSMPAVAQEQVDPATTDPATGELAVEKKSPQTKSADANRVREANINLRTTVTGNQEQPRVMYILPWQSPASPDLEMEMLSSQQDAVFGHVERDELQRSLEATGELDEPIAD